MSDPARLLQTNLDSTFRRALDAAITAEPPQGEQSKIWQSIALALPSGVLLGATTSASAATLSGAATSATINGAATSSAAVTSLTAASTVGGAATSAAINGAATSAAIGSSINATAAGGIASASATAGAVGGGLGLVAVKAVAVGLGLGLLVNTTVVGVPKLFDVSSAASAQVAPVPPRRAKPQSNSNARLAIDPAQASPPPVLSAADAFSVTPPSGDSRLEIRTLSESATSPSTSLSVSNSTSGSAAPGTKSESVRLERDAQKSGASADRSNMDAASPDSASASANGASANGASANGASANGASADNLSPSADELRDESRLLARARQAVNASNCALAIGLISEHRRAFPAGRLVQERDALEVQALQRSARYNEARARARAFLVHFPLSPHREKMRAIAEGLNDHR